MSLLEPSESKPLHATAVWRVQLLGGLRLQRADVALTQLGSRSVAALLARLALYPQRSHAREELIELLWPGVALDVGRNRLRQALFTLRQTLEPPGPMPAPVLRADRGSVSVVSGAIECDVHAFERHVREGRAEQALSLYRGDLMPGYYEDWIDEERLRLAALHDQVNLGRPAGEPPPAPAGRAIDAWSARPDAASATATAPAALAAPDTAGVGPSSLPVYLTRYFGRDDDGARLRDVVCADRLVTLLGPGGAGKTRLAVELAARLRDANAGRAPPSGSPTLPRFDFVAFVPLVNCQTRAQLIDALMTALHLQQQRGDAMDSLVSALGGRRVLLVLDNFEQLCGVGEDVVAALTQCLPSLHLPRHLPTGLGAGRRMQLRRRATGLAGPRTGARRGGREPCRGVVRRPGARGTGGLFASGRETSPPCST